MSSVTEQVGKNLDLTINKPLKTLIYEAFKKTIILGDIPAGERINEKAFAEAMNISRTPVRNALKQLTEEKLLEYQPGTGVIVRGISIRDAYEIYDIRAALDSLATIRAMELMSQKDFDELDALIEAGLRLNEEDRVDEVMQNFSDFNSFIYKKAQMPRLKAIVTSIGEYLIYFRDLAIRAKERRDVALDEHALLVRCMKNRDEEQIALVVREHLDHSLHFIVKEMEERQIE